MRMRDFILREQVSKLDIERRFLLKILELQQGYLLLLKY
jgi:hypothetical protein